MLNLHKATSGKVMFAGENIATLDEARMRPYRRQLQIVFGILFAQPAHDRRRRRSTSRSFQLATKSELPSGSPAC